MIRLLLACMICLCGTALAQQAELLLHFTFDDPLDVESLFVPGELANPPVCRWGRVVGHYGRLAYAKEGQPWTAAQQVEGRLGKALQFRGNVARNWIRVPDGDAIDFGTADFSVTFWLRSTGGGSLFVRTTTPPFWLLALTGEGKLRLMLRAAGEQPTSVAVSSGGLNDGQWHHVAMLADRDGQLTFYIDGRAAGGMSMASQAGTLDDTQVLGIGGYGYDNGYFDGVLDDIRIYRGLLSEEQLAALATAEQ